MALPAVVAAVTAAIALTAAETASAERVAKPRFVRNLETGQTGWFSSPGLVDLNGDGRREIVAPFWSTHVFSAQGRLLGRGTATSGRVYAPGVVADLDSDGRPEIVVGGNEGTVAAYNLAGGGLELKPGWPASTCSAGQCPEARGMAAADLDRNGSIETVVTTTNTATTGAQVFVFNASGGLYRPGGATTAWPRYNATDRTFNAIGNHGYGAYGENVGIGNVDDDRELELVVTFDNHQINVFNHDGRSVLASRWFKNRHPQHRRARLGWGQIIRWLSPRVEARHLHRRRGPWPDVRRTPWLQWSTSPPTVADLNRDGRNEVIGVPNVERGIPYRTIAYAFMAFDGAHRGGRRSARRHRGFVSPPISGQPHFGDPYPVQGIPAPTVVNVVGNRRPEIIAPVSDGHVYAISSKGRRLWRFDYARGAPETFASEVVAADLNRDGRVELVFGTYGPQLGAGRLVVLSRRGRRLHDIQLRDQRIDGNGVGVPAAPSIADLNGDGRLEIVLTTFDHGVDVYRVPRSGTGRLPWPTGRGSLLRSGIGPATAP